MGEIDRPDPSQLRISDADRHKVAEILREAAGEGRLDMEELDERLEATYAARTYADLVPITSDLPVQHQPAQPPRPVPAQRAAFVPARGGPSYTTSLAIMSGQDRRGVWEVGPTHNAFSLMGGITLDLREAHFTTQEVLINASTIMGGISIVVNARTRVIVEGVGVMGAFDEARPKVDPDFAPDSPLVRVRGFALMGGVDVTRKPMPGETPRRWRALPGH